MQSVLEVVQGESGAEAHRSDSCGMWGAVPCACVRVCVVVLDVESR